MTMETMTRCLEFFESRLTKLFNAPPRGLARHALALLAVMICAVGEVSAQADFVGALKDGGERKSINIYLEKNNTPVGIGANLQTFVNGLNLGTDETIYARLFFSDASGNVSLCDATFGGESLKEWTYFGADGYIYFGTGFSANMLSDLTVSTIEATNVSLVITRTADALSTIKYNILTGDKKWRIAYEYAGHMNEGGWYAGPNEKKGEGAYDDRIYFLGDKYYYDAGYDGLTYIHGTYFDDYENNERNVNLGSQEPKPWKLETIDGVDYLVLPQGGAFPYLNSNTQYTQEARYRIDFLSSELMKLTFADTGTNGSNQTRSFILTVDKPYSEDVFKPAADTNLLKGMSWSKDWPDDVTVTKMTDTSIKVEIQNASNNLWEKIVKLKAMQLSGGGNMSLSKDKSYDFALKLKSDKSFNGATVKIEKTGDGGTSLTKDYRFPLTANEEHLFYLNNVPGSDITGDATMDFVLDFGGNPANTTIEITDMVLQEHTYDEYTQSYNLWKDVTKTTSFSYTNNNTADQGLVVTNDRSYQFGLLAHGGDNNAWDSQFIINTNLNLDPNKTYDFSCLFSIDRGDHTVEVKLEDPNSGEVYVFDKSYLNKPANSIQPFAAYGLSGTAINNAKLVFGFGENGDGAKVTISDIIIKETALGLPSIIKEPTWDAHYLLLDFGNNPSATDYTKKSEVVIATGQTATATIENIKGFADEANVSVLYMRWFIEDMNGNYIAPTNGFSLKLSDTSNSTDISFEENASITEKAGQFWHSTSGISLGNVKFELTVPAGYNVGNYKVVAIASTSEGDKDGTKLYKEPEHNIRLEFLFDSMGFVSDESNLSKNSVSLVKIKDALYNETTKEVSPALFANWREVIGDLAVSRSDFAKKGYLRWYIVDKGNNLLNNAGYSAGADDFVDRGQYGIYYLMDSGRDLDKLALAGPDNTDLDPVFILPNTLPTGNTYKDINVVCVVTDDTDGNSLPNEEPRNIKAKYIFKLYTENDYSNMPFVHSTGVSKRPFESVSNKIPGASDSGTKTQYVWNYDTASYAESTEGNDIRQSVHTVIYDYYVETDKEINLRLPFAIDYTKNTEPLGYFRWYNYLTDMKAGPELTKKGSSLVETDRGFIALRPVENSQNADDDNIGVLFKPTSETTYPLYIACDVSRYFDGIEYTTGKYMLHEPTLSMRYIFRINKAQTIADNIETQFNSSWQLVSGAVRPKAESIDTDEKAAKVFSNLEEDNGLVVVSLNGTKGEFALRMDKAKAANVGDDNNGPDLVNVFGNYFLQNSATQAKKLRWDVYYKDDNEGWMVKPIDMTKETFIGFGVWKEDYHDNEFVPKFQKRSGWRIGTYTLDDFVNATGFEYQRLDGNATSAGYSALTLATAVQTTFHVVGVLSSDDNVERPVAHYELKFLDAKPLLYSELESNTSRKDDVLREKLPLGTTLTFDDYFSTDTQIKYKKPENSVENYASMPLAWDNAQYGFCYPDLYAYNGTSYRITRKDWWQGFGFSPLHGDYTLLKSMYLPKVSVPGETEENVFYTNYFRDNKLPNYTSTSKYANVPKDQIDTPFYDITNHKTNGADFGTFLYVDAADEPRTIAKLSFDAAGLCENSELYYTAYLADLTSPRQTAPQVMFHVYTFKDNDKTKERSLVMSFLASDLSTLISDYSTMQLADKNNASTASPKEYDVIQKDLGHWYQIYGHVTIPKGKLPEVDAGTAVHFEVEIDNYATSTCGADYGIDEISFYTSAANLYVEQNSNTVCDANGKLEARFYLGAENLQNVLTKSKTKRTIYYRIVNAETNQPATGIKYSTTTIDDSGVYSTVDNDLAYGQVEIITDYTDAQVVENSARSINNPVGFYKDADGNVEFCLAWRNDYPFDGNTKYYMSLLDLNYTPSSTDANDHWGCPENSCSIYSASFIARKVHLDLLDGDTPISEKTASCDGWWRASVTAAASLPKGDGYVTGDNGFNIIKNMHYDYWVGTLEDFTTTTNLMQALDDYRDQSGFDKAGLDAAYKTVNEAYYRVLETEVAEGRLLLNFSSKFEYEFVDEGLYNFVAIPYERFVDLTGNAPVTYRKQKSNEAAAICQPIPFSLNYKSSQPRLELGFDDVDYPATDTYRTIRIGTDQIKKLQSDYILHVPVRDYANKSKTPKTGSLTLQSFKLFGTNDPTITKANVSNGNGSTTKDDYVVASSETLATFEESKVDKDKMYISLNFHGTDVTKLKFREGYEYKIILQYHDSDDDSDDNRCESSLPLLFKIVPEYVTWEGATMNINWQNDENWSRSKKADLYKTAAQYTDNGDAGTELEGLGTDQPKSYVPMKFTYVTLPTANRAPQLLDLKMSTDPNNQVISNVSEGIDAASTNIQYDIMVRYSFDASDGQDKCLGHKTHNGTAWVDSNVGKDAVKTFDCEKFYGNICKEIYFKPEAELMNQQHLTYDKAWVERELKKGQWYLMSAPLNGIYSGDMYVPGNGRQETEAFVNIKFDDTATSGNDSTKYSRTKYPIYQRSWTDGKATVQTNGSNYPASVGYTANVTEGNFAEWSHTYNDVDVKYSTDAAFAIRAGRAEWAEAGDTHSNAIIRLPKADTSYTYYNIDGKAGDKTGSLNATLESERKEGGNDYTSTYGKFVIDGSADKSLTNLQVRDDSYYLVGNPYMASLNMSDFLEKNKDLFENKYWTYDFKTGNPTAVAGAKSGIIKPLQSFFVKKKTGTTATTVAFIPEMTIDGNSTPEGTTQTRLVDPTSGSDNNSEGGSDNGSPTNGARQRLTISAKNGSGQSQAVVIVDQTASEDFVDAEDVETLFDSNLAGVPMVYTVAGRQATSIDVRPTVELIPFGVTCADNNGLTEVTVDTSHLSTLASHLYLLDAKTMETVEVTEGRTITVQPNDYGRYYLTTRGTTGIRQTEADGGVTGIVVSVRGREVTVRSQEPLTAVRLLTTGGETVESLAASGTEASMTLKQGGVYIVEARTTDRTKTVKVIVK